MKAMILYYSKSGKTENLVHKICELQGKIVVPFATSGMDSITKSLSTLETVCAGATVKFPFTKIKWKKSDTQDWLDTLKTEFAHK